MAHIDITVVVPTYRRPDLLKRCLHALGRQTYPKNRFEVIVVSDGPDSQTESVVQALRQQYPDLQLSCTALETQRGPAAARNAGWRQGHADLVAFTDDDCLPSMLWLEEYVKAYRPHSGEAAAFTGKVTVPVPDPPTDYQKNVAHLSTADFITANCACSRKALELTSGFDEAFPAAWREDSDLEFNLLKNNIPIIHVRQAHVCHPVRDAEWGISIREQRKSMFNALLFKKYPNLYRKKISARPVWNYYVIILSSLAFCVAWTLHEKLFAAVALSVWFFSILAFIIKRLRGTDGSFSHRMEMIITSIVIPYLSVYWTLRGAMRYKVFFL